MRQANQLGKPRHVCQRRFFRQHLADYLRAARVGSAVLWHQSVTQPRSPERTFSRSYDCQDLADMVISMDADLQDDIDAVDAMVDKYHEGCDIVYGVRSSREKIRASSGLPPKDSIA